MSERGYICIYPHSPSDTPGMTSYVVHAHIDYGKKVDDFDFDGPDDLIVDNKFNNEERAKMWAAHAMDENAIETCEAIEALLPLGRVSLEVSTDHDENQYRGDGQRLAWKSDQSFEEIAQDLEVREQEWKLNKGLPDPASAPSRFRF